MRKKIPRRKQKVKYSRKLACQHLEPKGDISNSLQPLCFCPERDLVLGTRAYVCQVCSLYNPRSNISISEIYAESKKIAEKQIKDINITNGKRFVCTAADFESYMCVEGWRLLF